MTPVGPGGLRSAPCHRFGNHVPILVTGAAARLGPALKPVAGAADRVSVTNAREATTEGPLSKTAVFVTVVRRAGPHLMEASLIPTALFYVMLVLVGLGAALLSALGWSYLALARRLVSRRPVPPLLLLGVIGLTVRTGLATATGSSFVYFAQPVLGAVVMAAVFLVSVWVGQPLVERLALEFWPVPDDVMVRPSVVRLFRSLTFLWAGVNGALAITSLTLLLALPLQVYVAVKQLVSLVITGTGIAITVDASVRTARREGIMGHGIADEPSAVVPDLVPIPMVALAAIG